jgi:hypothetical protein
MDSDFPAWRIGLAAVGFVWLVEAWLRHRRRQREHSAEFDPTLERLWRTLGWTLAITSVAIALLVGTHLPRWAAVLVGVPAGAGGLLAIAVAASIGLRVGRSRR